MTVSDAHASLLHDANGIAPYTSRPLPGGVYVPVPTPFRSDGSEELDLVAWKDHILRMARAGVGLVVMGTTGEASHLSRDERYTLISTARRAIDAASLTTPIIAGTGTGSLKETIALSQDAARAGADAVIVISPGYFANAIARDRKALVQFFQVVAQHSHVPVMIYNFPASAAGIDLDSDLLEEIAQHPNICGAKLTCAMIGKGHRLSLSRLAASTPSNPFHVFPGYGDIVLPALVSRHTGVIAGTGNLCPRLLLRAYDRAALALGLDPQRGAPAKKKASAEERMDALEEAQKLQDLLSRADWAMSKIGIPGAKWAIGRYYNPYGPPRMPLQPFEDEEKIKVFERELEEAMEMERQLEEADGVTPARI